MYETKGLFNSSSYKQALVVLGSALAVSLLATVIIKATGERDAKHKLDKLLVVAEGSDYDRDSFKRFNRSLQVNELDLVVLRPSRQSDGETKATKIDLLRQLVGAYRNEQNLLILVVDGNSAIINGDRSDIIARLSEKFSPKTRVIFSADAVCWPNAALESSYPKPVGGGERFLNSRAFIGYADALWELLNVSLDQKRTVANQTNGSRHVDSDADDDEVQSYFTQIYLNPKIRPKVGVELDHRAEIFQNLHKSQSNVELEIETESVKLKNSAYLTEPVVVQANEANKVGGSK